MFEYCEVQAAEQIGLAEAWLHSICKCPLTQLLSERLVSCWIYNVDIDDSAMTNFCASSHNAGPNVY